MPSSTDAPLFSLNERVAVITGAASGIGHATAQRFVAAGAQVVLLDRDDAGRAAQDLSATALRVDVSDEQAVANAMSSVAAEHGRIDILVNNAGIWGDYQRAPLAEVDLGYWDRVLAVNLTGPLLCSQAVLPTMRAQQWGRIVNISSMGAHMASGVYGVSKLALNQLTFALATEVGNDGITVNAVAPGTIDNEATQRQVDAGPLQMLIAKNAVKRAGTADDLYGAVRYLASDEAAWVTGQTLLVNGGFSARF
jgi:NAD(P)-dependent dehydrogenase (short-subunit alcohol dehydrogenase family)